MKNIKVRGQNEGELFWDKWLDENIAISTL